MTRRPTLRQLVLVPVLATIVLGFAGFAVYIDRIERMSRLDDLDTELVRAERAASIQRQAQPAARGAASGPPPDAGGAPAPAERAGEPALDQPPIEPFEELSDAVDAPIQLLLDDGGGLVSTGGNQSPFSGEQHRTFAAVEAVSVTEVDGYRVRVSPEVDGAGAVTVTALPLADLDAATDRFRRALVLGGLVIAALVAFAVWLVTSVLIRPVTRLTNSATRIADGNFATAIDEPGGSSEMARLAADLNRMLDTLQSAISERTQAAAEAKLARDDMQRFLADMAHELRTPLTALKGYSDLYEGGMLPDTADVDRAMSRIGSESDRLSRLATGMLQLARRDLTTVDSEPTDVVGVLHDVADDLRAAYPEHPVETSIDAPDGRVIVDGVRAHLHQALLNLGSNACNHSPAGTPIEMTVRTGHDDAVIAVIDHGVGVDPADAERIFLPFFRADTSRSRRDGDTGSGIGLALTKQIVDQHDATIEVSETPGGGATFTVTIPR